jgi:tetratricopeptide (TPR) repeat protein
MADRSHLKAGLLTGGLLPVLLVIIGVIAYLGSFSGPFIFDDAPNIVDNPSIRQLWPLTNETSTPHVSGLGSRPVLSLSFALNYAFGEYRVWGYHFVNLTIHILAALALYGIVRRTLRSERLKEKFGPHSASLAWIAAAIWLVHPIQTESVTYIVQRAESLMGLFYLLTVYSAIRTMQPEHSRLWLMLSVVFCALGMATKEVMVTAPVIVFLYDRTFAANSFSAALKKRLTLYLGLAATWIVLVVVMASGTHSDTVGFSVNITPLDYCLNQCIAIVKYIGLCLWPRRLCLYYCWPVIKAWSLILPSLLMIVFIAAVTLWGFIRNRVWSYPLVWFFTILAPTSSFVPIADIIFEHRVYLSLAGLAVIVVTGGYLLLELVTKRVNLSRIKNWLGIGIATTIIVALTTGTIYRNKDYQSNLSIWQSVVKAAPSSYRGYYNLGSQLKNQGEIAQAIDCYLTALRINPDYIDAHHKLGNILKSEDRVKEAAYYYRQILRIDPNHVEANFNLGVTFQLQGLLGQAVIYYRRTLELKPDYVNAHNNLGSVLLSQGNFDEAVSHFNSALKIDPNDAGANNNLAYALISRPGIEKNDITRAVELARRAAELTEYRNPEILETLADCYSKDGKSDLAVQTAEKALELALAADNKQLVESIRGKLQLYKKQTH